MTLTWIHGTVFDVLLYAMNATFIRWSVIMVCTDSHMYCPVVSALESVPCPVDVSIMEQIVEDMDRFDFSFSKLVLKGLDTFVHQVNIQGVLRDVQMAMWAKTNKKQQ